MPKNAASDLGLHCLPISYKRTLALYGISSDIFGLRRVQFIGRNFHFLPIIRLGYLRLRLTENSFLSAYNELFVTLWVHVLGEGVF